jgi:hypothetical protein
MKSADGLGTNLAELGMNDLTTRRILRRSNLATRQHYIKVRNPKVQSAVQMLEPIQLACWMDPMQRRPC